MYEAALSKYIEGEWEEAQKQLIECKHQKPTDGPTQSILEYMSIHDFARPKDWQGCRISDG